MFVADCDTDAPLRKAISHIFGRNKLCTRLIPPAVWVHWCRKHYQRCRYRNPAEYATRQADMVTVQIDRVQEWSNDNKTHNRPGIVLSWTIQPRKREAQRISEQDGEDGAQQTGHPGEDQAIANGTAIPNWLLAECDKEFTTAEVQAVVRRIQQEMEQGYLQQIPDIEILPNISTEGGGTTKPKSTLKRKMGGAPTHKRSQSLRIGGQSMSMAPPMTRRASHQGYDHNQQTFSPAEKRQCIGPIHANNYYSPNHGFPPMPPRSEGRIVPHMSSHFAFNYPPVMDAPGENVHQYHYQTPNLGPPAVYQPQGVRQYEPDETLSNRPQPTTRIPMFAKVHHRSQSEMAVSHQMPAGSSSMHFMHYDTRPTSSTEYSPQNLLSNLHPPAGGHAGHGIAYENNMPAYYDQNRAVRNWPHDGANLFQPNHLAYANQPGHGRRQSTPVMSHPYPVHRGSIAVANTTAPEVLPPLHTLTHQVSYIHPGHENAGVPGAEDHKGSQRVIEVDL